MFWEKLVSLTIQPFRLLHVFYIHNQSYKNVTIDFVIMTRSMQSVISCSCCCFSASRSHFACFSQARGAGFYTKLNVWGSLGLNSEYDGGPIIEIGGPIFLDKLRILEGSTSFHEGSVLSPGQLF